MGDLCYKNYERMKKDGWQYLTFKIINGNKVWLMKNNRHEKKYALLYNNGEIEFTQRI